MDDTQWRTHRLELDDQTLREWDATVLAAGADGIVLDRSAFYPGGGGQPPDHGVLLWGGVSRPGAAEVAFVVIDDYQGQGIGAALLRHLAAIARSAGLKELVAEVLPENISG